MWLDYLKWLWILYIEEQSMDSRQVPISQPPAGCWADLAPNSNVGDFVYMYFVLAVLSCVDTVRSVRQVLVTAMYCRLLGCPSAPNLVLVILPYLFAQHVWPRPELDAVIGQASPHHSSHGCWADKAPNMLVGDALYYASYVIIRILYEFELIVN